jgi:hypothetical protein
VLAAIFKRWETHLSQRDTNRRVRPFEWGLEFTGSDGSRVFQALDARRPSGGPGSRNGDARSALIDFADRALADSDSYHSYEPVRDYRLEGNHLTFTSPVETIYPPNNTVHGWYFPAESRGRVVLVLPQWNCDARGHMSLCRMMRHFGLSSMRLSLPHHDLRMSEELARADYMLSPNLGRTLLSMRQAVIDARACLDWLEQQGYRRFAVLGTSIGSCVALITLAHDRRLTHSVQNHISPYFADVVWEGISTKHVRKGLEGHVSLEDLRRIWMPISPKAYLPKLAGTGKGSLLVHALYDHSFLPHLSEEVLRDYATLGLPHKAFKLYCGHYTSGEFPFNIVLGYAMCDYLRRNL